jgi:aspartate ammonia-lyase
MSKQTETVVDSRVVQLTLNNESFEQNAAKSISTITKLKEALNFSDAGKGLNDISKGVQSININVLTQGVRSL